MKDETKIIIPAAGYGTRVGGPDAKELLSVNNQGPLIKKALDLALSYNYRAHVITRADKKDLITYLQQFNHVDIQIITPSKEWPDTVLQSMPFWAAKNILLLPDTHWSPDNVLSKVNSNLDRVQVVPGYFNPQDKRTWGVFKLDQDYYELCEKPKTACEVDVRAWGIMGFKKEIGELLFKNILESTFDHLWKKTDLTCEAVELDFFTDLTREAF